MAGICQRRNENQPNSLHYVGTQWRPKEAYASNISGFVNLKEGTSD